MEAGNTVSVEGELPMGADVVKKNMTMADLRKLITEHKHVGEINIPHLNQSITVRFISALGWIETQKKYPPPLDKLSDSEQNMAIIINQKSEGKAREDWLKELTEPEFKLLVKLSEIDTDAVKRIAFIMSKIAITPKMTEPEAMEILESIENESEFDKIVDDVQTYCVPPKSEIKNS